MRQRVYLGLDAHVCRCVLAGMDTRGKLLSRERRPTSEAALISHIVAIKARKKLLALEESSLADWLAGEVRPYVDDLIVCDPRHNALISMQAAREAARHDMIRLGVYYARSLPPIPFDRYHYYGRSLPLAETANMARGRFAVSHWYGCPL